MGGGTVRVLVISPRFAPANAADSHRIRLLLPYLKGEGCQVEVLAVDARDTQAPIDPWLAQQLPPDIPVHRVRAWQLRGWGLNGLAQRAWVPLYRRGAELLAGSNFDLVMFSTTEFLLHLLGPLWQQRYGVPFCMDFQDPWVSEYSRLHPEVVPPGGRLKYGLISRLHSLAEKYVVPRCAGFLAVSAPYLDALEVRYGAAVATQPKLVQPFPAEPSEFDSVANISPHNTTPLQRAKIIRYIGRGGADMALAAGLLFEAWRELLDDGKLSRMMIRFEALGTSYAAPGSGKPSLAPISELFGLGDLVLEVTDRLGYSAMLATLVQSDALVVFGSDDPAYTASKIYPYLLARRPMLAIFHQQSSVVTLMDEVGGGRCVKFNDEPDSKEIRLKIQAFLLSVAREEAPTPLVTKAFKRYCASSQAQELVKWFSLILARNSGMTKASNHDLQRDGEP